MNFITISSRSHLKEDHQSLIKQIKSKQIKQIKFASTLLIAGSLGQINAIRVASGDRVGEMERCGPSTNDNR